MVVVQLVEHKDRIPQRRRGTWTQKTATDGVYASGVGSTPAAHVNISRRCVATVQASADIDTARVSRYLLLCLVLLVDVAPGGSAPSHRSIGMYLNV
ncbi:hypothetical protein CH260_04875 [Rhodococcus sp. 05-2256-B2]|nr:hypothetical protein CH258_14145 [Rhodococcus sp. 05-2256-B4]OZD99282.1 hypothetical protein CH257_00485 [Rhodococcus sp. 05-2256-B3]OZE00660.1 hypothetical protein CH260_04875 [Rhodococcus sp. 05-2256-B2]OZE02806.1 hypothetical protein CH285_12600 [Rhodococcus sp. 05-2256-B1]